MKKAGILLLVGALLLPGCATTAPAAEPAPARSYQAIDQRTASEMMAADGDTVIVDVRRIDEFESGHIPGAICIPNESITVEPPEELPNLNETVLVYCRSGNRSKQAAEKLAAIGYTNIFEFGGIIDWSGEVVPGQVITVTVESNPTTGFRWAAEQDSELFSIRDSYVSRPQSEGLSGAGGWQTFVLTPLQSGTATVSFTYSRPWEPQEDDPQLRYTLTVSEDFRITLTGDGSAEAAESGYIPVVKLY
jgi:rhodanese-related sulfurtransferase